MFADSQLHCGFFCVYSPFRSTKLAAELRSFEFFYLTLYLLPETKPKPMKKGAVKAPNSRNADFFVILCRRSARF